MNREVVKAAIVENGNDIYFTHCGLKCGIAIEGQDGKFKFQSWCGKSTREYDNIDTAMKDEFFSGKSLNELIKNGLEVNYA